MDTPIIDFHNHIGRLGVWRMDDDQTRFLRIMDAAGVDLACVFCIWHGDHRYGNDLTARFVAKNPSRFIGAGYVNPRYPDEAIQECERAIDELGMKFIKLYPSYVGRPIDDAVFEPVLGWANDRGLVVMSHHNHWPEPKRYMVVAGRFPRVKWVMAHAGNGTRAQAEAVEAARFSSNIYLELSSSYSDSDTVSFLVDGAGADRVLLGSDMPEQDVRHHVGRILTADISEEAKRKVLGLNAARLLKLDL